MKILLLNPASKFSRNVVRDVLFGCGARGRRIGGASFPPLSLLYVGTVLKNIGQDVALLDANEEQKSLDYVKDIVVNYDLVVITSSTMSFDEDAQTLSELKKANKGLITLVFGAHPSFMPKEALEREGVDVIVRREPEFVIRDFVLAKEEGSSSWENIKGIGFKRGEERILNDDYPFIEDLDKLPFPERTLLSRRVEYFNPVVKRYPFTTMLTSRGCPGRCIFCTSPSFYGNKVRFRSAENVVKELGEIWSQGYREVFFRDEIFPLPRLRAEKICQEIIKEKLDLSWICSAKIGTVDNKLMELMKKAGCHLIRFGVESGVQEILDNVQKGITVEEIRRTFKWAHHLGMDTQAHLMLGMPGESKETIKQTIKFVKEIEPTIATFGICTPYPGTKLFEEVLSQHPEIGDGTACDLSKIHTKGFFNQFFTSLSNEELERSILQAYRSFYLRISYIFGWLKRLKSIGELRRVVLAGFKVLGFILKGE